MTDQQPSIQAAHGVSNEVDLSARQMGADDLAQRPSALFDAGTGWDAGHEYLHTSLFECPAYASPVVDLEHGKAFWPDLCTINISTTQMT